MAALRDLEEGDGEEEEKKEEEVVEEEPEVEDYEIKTPGNRTIYVLGKVNEYVIVMDSKVTNSFY